MKKYSDENPNSITVNSEGEFMFQVDKFDDGTYEVLLFDENDELQTILLTQEDAAVWARIIKEEQCH